MGDEDGDDRQRIADEEGGPLVKADAGDQDEQRGAGRGNIHRADADLRQYAGGWRDRDAPAAQPDRASAPSRPDGKAGDRQQQRDAQSPQQVRRPGQRADRHHLRTPDQHRACQHEHPAPEGRAGDRHHARNVAERQARRRIDAVAGRSARQQRQAKIMAERIAGEGCQRRSAIGQGAADGPQRRYVIEGQRQIADRRQRRRRQQAGGRQRVPGRPDLMQMDLLQQMVERHEAQRGQQYDDAHRQGHAIPLERVARHRAIGHAVLHPRCRVHIWLLHSQPRNRQPDIFNRSASSCSIVEEKLRPLSGTKT